MKEGKLHPIKTQTGAGIPHRGAEPLGRGSISTKTTRRGSYSLGPLRKVYTCGVHFPHRTSYLI
jgi:hypothetical protein